MMFLCEYCSNLNSASTKVGPKGSGACSSARAPSLGMDLLTYGPK